MKPGCFIIGTTLADNPVSHHFEALAEELKHRGHQVVIITPHRRMDLVNAGSNPTILTWPSERPTSLRDALFLRDLIRERQPSALIANFAAVNLMMVMGWLSRVPVRVAWYHTISKQIQMDSPQGLLKRALLRFRKKLVYKLATHIAANSKSSAQDIQEVFGVPKSKCVMFHNAIKDPVEAFLLTPELPTPGHILCVGRFDWSKGQDVLIKALVAVRKKIPTAQVEFVGIGAQLERCKQLACELGVLEKCTFSGRVPHEEVLKRMGTAVVTVVPSRSEAFGLVNIESMAVGTPVVASNVGGIPEIIRSGTDGLLVEPENPEALASALKSVLSDPHLRREMRINARDQFLSRFELSRVVREQSDWLELALEARS